ncbi:MAG: hypothetical protein JXA25_12270 [Anaerolineales bacterium]|nr:hypothetical protein [Anaerolineales bacterium]
MKIKFAVLIIIIHSFLLSGCVSEIHQPLPSSTPTIVPPTSTAAAPESDLRISIESLNLQQERDGTIHVYGIAVNQSEHPLSNVRIKIVLQDSLEKTITLSIPLLIENLYPDESSPFTAAFTGVHSPATAYAEVTGAEIANFQRANTEFSEPIVYQNLDGETWLSLTASNPTSDRFCMLSARVGAFSPDGELMAVNSEGYGSHTLDARTTRQYYFEFASVNTDVSFRIFMDSQLCGPEIQDPNIGLEAGFFFDAQGNPFLAGSLINHETFSTRAAAVLTLVRDNQPLSVVEIVPPVPLQPGEILPFTTNSFPGLSLEELRQHLQRGNVEIQTELDPARSTATEEQLADLTVSINSLETSGSKLILSGTVENDQELRVLLPSVLLQITTTDGALITAGWDIVADAMQPGEKAPFILILPIPDGADLRMSEQDLRSFGIMVSVTGQ